MAGGYAMLAGGYAIGVHEITLLGCVCMHAGVQSKVQSYVGRVAGTAGRV